MAILCRRVFLCLAHLCLGMAPHQWHLVAAWVKVVAACAQVFLKSRCDHEEAECHGSSPQGYWIQLPRTLSTHTQDHKTHPLPRETSLKTWVSRVVTVEHRESRTVGDKTVFRVESCVRCWLWRSLEARRVCAVEQRPPGELCVL